MILRMFLLSSVANTVALSLAFEVFIFLKFRFSGFANMFSISFLNNSNVSLYLIRRKILFVVFEILVELVEAVV